MQPRYLKSDISRGVAVDSVGILLEYLGFEWEEDSSIKETPKRVIKAFEEMTSGYKENPEEILSSLFDSGYDEMVILRGTRFTSLCEHHLLPFVGTVDFAYIPEKQVVGVSKISRLILCFAKRLQIQERMTCQIAQSFDEILKPKGVAVVARASHSCMGCRGVKQQDTEMVTSQMLGAFKENVETRQEFLNLIGGK